MYDIGELIIYGRIGVCKVKDVTTSKFSGASENQKYYVLELQDKNGNIYIPVNTKVFMRPVMKKEEAEQLIRLIPSMQAQAYNSPNLQELTRHYMTALQAHNCECLIKVVMSISTKKQERQHNNKKIGAVDTNFLKHAEDLLYSEFSIALDVPKQSVAGYIATRVEGMHTNGEGELLQVN